MRTKEEVHADLKRAADMYIYRCDTATAQARFRDRIEYLLCEADAIRAVDKFAPMEAQYRRECEERTAEFKDLLDGMQAQFREAVKRFEASPQAQKTAEEWAAYNKHLEGLGNGKVGSGGDQNPGANL